MNIELDPRWEWVDISTLEEGPGTTFIKAYCNHLELEPVENVEGQIVARLCLTCDRQFLPPRIDQ